MELRRESLIFSGLLHLTLALLAIFGLPSFWNKPVDIETPMVVDLVPIGAKSNPPPKQAEAPQPEPAKPEPPKAEQPKPEPPKPEPKPTPPPAPTPPPPPKPPEPAPAPPVPKPEPKPEPKPDTQKMLDSLKPPPKPQPQNDVDSLLKSIDKKKPTPPNPLDDLLKSAEKGKPTPPTADQGTKSTPQSVRGSDMHNPNEPISMTEMDRIRKHVSDKWSLPAGAKDAANLVVEIRVSVLPDGTVSDAQIVNRPMMADSFWQAAADSARRAVRLASPLPIPPGKYDQFKDFTLVFNPKQMFGGR